MVEPILEQINKWKAAGKTVKYIWLDNAGKKKKLKACSESSDWKMNITFEFMARDTQQQNHSAEIRFAVIANCGRALMYHANVPLN